MSVFPDHSPPMAGELWWPGIFRPLLHDIPRDGRSITLRGVRVFLAACDAACRPPHGRVPEGYRYCPCCLARRERLTQPGIATPDPVSGCPAGRCTEAGRTDRSSTADHA